MTAIYKSPRLYTDQHLTEGLGVQLTENAAHYLKNVLRVAEGDIVRIFNGREGEFVGRIERASKKSIDVTIEKKLRDQKFAKRQIHLFFAPLKKERMDFLIEKAVELGATDLYPILTQNTDMRKINEERITAQIIEAAEQCERLDIPSLHPPQDMMKLVSGWYSDVPVFAALERMDAEKLKSHDSNCAILIGPAGGFTEEEKQKLAAMDGIKPVSLGENILRAETAAIAALSIINL